MTKYIVVSAYIDEFNELQNDKPKTFDTQKEAQDYLKQAFKGNERWFNLGMDSYVDEEEAVMYFEDDTMSKLSIYEMEVE